MTSKEFEVEQAFRNERIRHERKMLQIENQGRYIPVVIFGIVYLTIMWLF